MNKLGALAPLVTQNAGSYMPALEVGTDAKRVVLITTGYTFFASPEQARALAALLREAAFQAEAAPAKTGGEA